MNTDPGSGLFSRIATRLVVAKGATVAGTATASERAATSVRAASGVGQLLLILKPIASSRSSEKASAAAAA
jgi:hypothetical protein